MSRKKPTPVEEAATEAARVVIPIGEYLRMAASERPSILAHEDIEITLSDGATLSATLRQLNKREAAHFGERALNMMPTVPTLTITTLQAGKDPRTGSIRPAGTYQEPNPQDPVYIRHMETWLNETAILLAIYSAHESLGVEPGTEEFDALFTTIETTFPPSTLLEMAIKAADLNPGIPIATEIRNQAQRARMQALAELDEQQLMEFLDGNAK